LISKGRTTTIASEEETNETIHQLQIPVNVYSSNQNKALAKDKEVNFLFKLL